VVVVVVVVVVLFLLVSPFCIYVVFSWTGKLVLCEWVEAD